MRLKAPRRGLQDFEYLRLAETSRDRTREDLLRMADERLLAPAGGRDYGGLRRALWESLAGTRGAEARPMNS
ncbi:MAG: hypothetical protein KIT09_12200 [Bryobacteraceae bacterium]|nr:hypothetical protein [Bryobacteraceae bacterium]